MIVIWFHGTDRATAQKILKNGFKKGTHFASHLEDALEFGGDHVFEVALPYTPKDPNAWQVCIPKALQPKYISCLRSYTRTMVKDFPKRNKAIFEFNLKEHLQEKANRLSIAKDQAKKPTSGVGAP